MKCPSCGNTDLINDFGTYECKNCGHDSDMFHFELQAENKRLREALEDVLAQASGQPKSCGHEFFCKCPFDNAKKALEKYK